MKYTITINVMVDRREVIDQIVGLIGFLLRGLPSIKIDWREDY